MSVIPKDAVLKRLQNLLSLNKKYNMFNYLPTQDKLPHNDIQGPLTGLITATKDNIVTNGMPTTCSSKILKGYMSPFDATVVKQLKEAGALNIGKVNMDEFGMGSGGTHSFYGPTINPYYKDELRVAGGSSSGSAASVSCGEVDFSLGTDTGGSVRLPASYCGVSGFKPSYGRVSRFGVVAYAQTLDTVGIVSKSIDVIKNVFKVLDKYDEKDPTSLPPKYRKELGDEGAQDKYVVGLVEQFNQLSIPEKTLSEFLKSITKILNDGHILKPVSIPSIEYSLPVYFTLAPAEAVSNLSRYDGVRYGHRDESSDMQDDTLYASTRTAFGEEVQNRIILGNYNLSSGSFSNNYLKAQKTRVHLIDEFDSIFKMKNCLTGNKQNTDGVDLLVSLTSLHEAPKLDDFVDKDTHNPIISYVNDVFTIPFSLTGLPCISIPIGETGLGLQITGQYGDDYKVLDAAKKFMKIIK